MRFARAVAFFSGVTAIGLLLTACASQPDRPLTAGPPSSLFSSLINACMPSIPGVGSMGLGTGGSIQDRWLDVVINGHDWHVRATVDHRVSIEPGGLDQIAPTDPPAALPSPDDPEVVKAVQVAEPLEDCISQYRFVNDPPLPTSRAGLLHLYEYDVTVLWPCLKAHGAVVGQPPDRSQFTSVDKALNVSPYSPARPLTRKSFAVLANASRYCPAVPAYLVGDR
ncbi:MAG TPA: hypothetical protein VGM70_04280 [Pseudolysinimonas sp.]|jgi:hypothetical protein